MDIWYDLVLWELVDQPDAAEQLLREAEKAGPSPPDIHAPQAGESKAQLRWW